MIVAFMKLDFIVGRRGCCPVDSVVQMRCFNASHPSINRIKAFSESQSALVGECQIDPLLSAQPADASLGSSNWGSQIYNIIAEARDHGAQVSGGTDPNGVVSRATHQPICSIERNKCIFFVATHQSVVVSESLCSVVAIEQQIP